MEIRGIADLEIFIEHISRFIDAVPSDSNQSADWSEIQTLRRSAVDSLQRLQGMAGPPAPDGSGDKCPGVLPKQ